MCQVLYPPKVTLGRDKNDNVIISTTRLFTYHLLLFNSSIYNMLNVWLKTQAVLLLTLLAGKSIEITNSNYAIV